MTRARDLADYISTGVSDTELDVLDGVTAGTVTASKALVVDANKDIASVRNITVDGTITLEGATANDFETVLNVTDPTADRTITFPDSTGTVFLNPNATGYSAFSSSSNLVISDSDAFAGITIHSDSSSTGAGYLMFADNSSQYAGYISYSHASDQFTFITNGSNTQMRIDSSGVTISDGLFLGDSHEINLGSSNDFKLYHDGSKNYIEAGTTTFTDLLITSTDDVIIGHGTASSYESMALFLSDNAVILYYDNTEKIRTSSSGIDVSGYVDVDSGIRHNGDTLNYISFLTDRQKFHTSGQIRMDIADGQTSVNNGLLANSYRETYDAVTSSSNAVTVDCNNGNAFAHTLTENTTFTFSNPPASGTAFSFSIEIIQDASASGYTVTWPTSVDWPSATAPTLTATASAKDVFVFYTRDGGTNWYGFTAGQALG